MRYTPLIAAAVALSASTAAMAQPKIYAYHSTHNFCPAGLQPVTMNGTICCGTPNQSMTYQQVKAHPVTRRTHVRASSGADCPVGTKGCTFD